MGVLAFFCEFEFSMIKYLFYWAGTAIFWLSCLSYNIARIFWHVKGGLVRDRENLPLDMIKNLCYMSLPSYIMDSSPWTLPQFRNGIVHFFVASNVAR